MTRGGSGLRSATSSGTSVKPDIFTATYEAEAAAALSGREAVAWKCEWIDGGEVTWSQYHDATDPMPETWDEPPDRITAFYTTPQGDGWRPIAEAPRDDGELLAFTITGNVRVEHTASIAALKAAAVRDADQCFYSHWMPLPAAPSAKGVVE